MTVPLRRRLRVAGLLALVCLAGLAIVLPGSDPPAPGQGVAELPSADPAGFVFERHDGPARTEVVDRAGVPVATLTDGARTVTVHGPPRTIAEAWSTPAAVTTDVYVRVAPQAWEPGADGERWARKWLATALADPEPDVLAVAMQYTRGAPDLTDASGTRYAGRATFGPEIDGGKRRIGADFYDYLGVSWRFPGGVEREPEAEQRGSLDCSGFLRIVYGYRAGFPLLAGEDGDGLPRRAASMATQGPGVVLVDDTGARPTALDALRPGDLLFFTTDDDPDIDHSAIYLGRDSQGHRRFVSSRGGADGPTMGDVNGPSVLDGEGFFAKRFREARRI